jgi:branched-chain amino acid transport system substrate-binding protein
MFAALTALHLAGGQEEEPDMASFRSRLSFSYRIGALALALALAVGLVVGLRASAPAAGEPYKLGAVFAESGPAATLGRPEAAAVKLAVDQINKAGGINGHQIELTLIDDQTLAANTVNGVRRLIDLHVAAVMAGSTTPNTLAVVPITDQAKLPLLNFASSANAITPVSERAWSFKDSPTDIQIGQFLQGILKRKGLTKIAFLYRNDDYGKEGLEHFKQYGEPLGFQVVDAEAMDSGATDVTTQLTKVRAANPQAIVVWSTLPSIVVAAKNYKQLGMNTPVYFSDGAADAHFPKLAGAAADGMHGVVLKIVVADQLPNGDPQKAQMVKFIKDFAAVDPQDSPASIFAAFGYDAMGWLKEVMAKAGTDNNKIREGLEHLNYTGVSGIFHLTPDNHNGFQPQGLALATIKNGVFVLEK